MLAHLRRQDMLLLLLLLAVVPNAIAAIEGQRGQAGGQAAGWLQRLARARRSHSSAAKEHRAAKEAQVLQSCQRQQAGDANGRPRLIWVQRDALNGQGAQLRLR